MTKKKNKQVGSKRLTPDEYPIQIENHLRERKQMRCPIPQRHLLRTQEQLEGIRKSAEINTGILDLVSKEIKIGMSTSDIDKLVSEYTYAHGAIPAPLNYEGFPKSCCTSIDEVVCHGIPSSKRILKDGDIVNVDVSTILDGYFSDASRMYMIGDVSEEKRRLVKITKECLEIGIQVAQPWARIGDIGAAIQEHAEANGYGVVRELTGHGVGIKFHESPEVLHYGRPNTGMLIVPGMTFTIEPMINMGTADITEDRLDGWTIRTRDGKPSAQWENMLLITEDGNEILTQ